MNDTRIVVPKPDFNEVCDKTMGFIKEIVEEAEAGGVAVGLSGGVDSSLVATLCVKALSNARVLGLLLPTDFTPQQDIEDALKLAECLGIPTATINVQRLYETFSEALLQDQGRSERTTLMGNILARIRMTILYYYANLNRYLVVGTGDRSEALIGYFTKYGDGGADLLPIIHLYKTQVRKLAKHLGVPAKISDKPSSPQLYPGHKATDEIPIAYEGLDPVLVGLFDLALSPQKVSQLTGISIDLVREVQYRFVSSRHKRMYPPMLKRNASNHNRSLLEAGCVWK